MSGIVASRLFARAAGPETWILGSADLDRYLTVPAPVLPILRRAVGLLDGTRSTEEVRGVLQDEFDRDLDVPAFVQRLRDAGLLRAADGQPATPPANRRLLAFDLWKMEFKPLPGWAQRHARAMAATWFALLLLSLGVSIPALLVGHGSAAPPAVCSPAAFVAAVLGCMLLHEASHGLAAMYEGIRPRSLTVSLYLGFVPMMYLRIPGLYTLDPRARVRVWSAGCTLNLAVALGAQAIAGYAGGSSGQWAALAVWNVAMIKLNLLPFLPTDGYFVLCTALREYNLRSRAHEVLRQWLRGRRASVRLWVGLYTVGTLAMAGRMGVTFGGWLVTHLGFGSRWADLLYAVPFVLWLSVVTRRRPVRPAGG